jgi:hypothetical protein
MNPALLNYLQAQNSQNQGAPDNQMQGVGQSAPSQGNYNPFDTGISKAIESARASLGMTQKQQDKALRSSMLAFANNMSQQPQERGFFNNFASVGKALAPALTTYDQEETTALGENNELANQILKYQATEQERQALAEQRVWQRQHSEAQLGELRRYHDLMAQKNNPAMNVNISGLGENFIPIGSKSERIPYTKDKKAIGSTLQELAELEKNYKEFRKDYKKNTIDPMSPYATIANPAKDFFGKFANGKKFRQETADRKTLASRLNKFVVSSERALKGGGVMGPTLIKLFKEQGIYPDLERDTPEDFASKLQMLREELDNAYEASNLSLEYNVHIDPYQLKDFKQNTQGQGESIVPDSTLDTESPNSEEYIVMIDPDTGEKKEVHVGDVEKAKSLGLQEIQ